MGRIQNELIPIPIIYSITGQANRILSELQLHSNVRYLPPFPDPVQSGFRSTH